jgi:hypothetical protein
MNLQEQIIRIHEVMGVTPINEGLQKINGLYLTFPKAGWETIATKLLHPLGVISGSFNNVEGAVKKIEKYKAKGKGTLDELVIGSHGDGTNLFMTKGGDTPESVNTILNAVRPVMSSNTKVFFTACFGADFLKRLTDASRVLGGQGVYGSAGVYNYITNKSQKGFYYCKASEDLQAKILKEKGSYDSSQFNQWALENGYCKKVDKAPINWVKNLFN